MMDAERWRRARALFDRLADASATDWETQLALACPDDAEVRAEALALLRADRTATAAGALAEAAPQIIAGLAEQIGAEEAATSAARAGLRLGPFRLVRQIGSGGMGAVWLCERVEGGFSQTVAIKLIRGGWDAADTQRRFLAERQILAGLQHPNIAHLIDGGVGADGKPWLALEYVDGESLLAWCDQRRLDLAARLRLFLIVCGAVAHAHQRLIVHRDLKPSNILVGRDGTVKLLDFGIAKMLDRAGEETATRLFTPDYAAPEQLRGEPVTTAVDVYALGLLLYELLTGRRPRESRGAGDGAEPLRPSAITLRDGTQSDAGQLAARRGLAPDVLRRRLRGDLDAIVMKALRSEPAQRYASVGEFADDVERHLRDRPVRARRDGWSYRSGRFARRHRWALAASAVGVLALAAGLGVALWQAHEAAAQRDVAVREADTARRTVDVLVGVFKAANPGTRPGETVTPADLLTEGEREVRLKLGAQPEQRAALLEALGRARNGLGTYVEAEPVLEEALALRIAGDDRLAEASVRLALSATRSRQSRNEDSLAEAERAYALSDDDSRQAAELRATADLHAGIELANLDRWAEAEPRLRRSAKARALLFGEDGEPYWQVLIPLSFNLSARQRADEALALLDPAWKSIVARTEPGDWQRGYLLDARAYALNRSGRYAEAVALHREALAASERVYGDDHPNYHSILSNLALALYQNGQFEEAAQAFDRIIRWRSADPARKQLQRRPDKQLRAYALALDASGRSDEAIDVLQRMQREREHIAGVTAADEAEAWLLLARAQRHARRHADAAASLATYFAEIEGTEARAAGLIERTWLAIERGTLLPDCPAATEAEQLVRAAAKPAEQLHAQATLAACWIETGRRDRAAALIATLTAPNRPALAPPQQEAVEAALARWQADAPASTADLSAPTPATAPASR
jgi:serine/threonine-protein kinase